MGVGYTKQIIVTGHISKSMSWHRACIQVMELVRDMHQKQGVVYMHPNQGVADIHPNQWFGTGHPSESMRWLRAYIQINEVSAGMHPSHGVITGHASKIGPSHLAAGHTSKSRSCHLAHIQIKHINYRLTKLLQATGRVKFKINIKTAFVPFSSLQFFLSKSVQAV